MAAPLAHHLPMAQSGQLAQNPANFNTFLARKPKDAPKQRSSAKPIESSKKTNGLSDKKVKPGTFSAYQPNNPALALGLAVNHLMTKTPFCDLKFGAWSKILTGQINRKHYLFVIQNGKPVGFAGWVYTNSDQAEAWLNNEANLGTARDGDCVIINIWEAATPDVSTFIRGQMRRIFAQKKALYARRLFKDGRVRPVRLNINSSAATQAEARDTPRLPNNPALNLNSVPRVINRPPWRIKP